MSETAPTVKIKSSHPQSQGDFVEINESDFDASKHERYDVPLPPPPQTPPVLIPPGTPDPLAVLASNWKEQDAASLKALAASIEGRAVENKAQAIAVIEAALAAKAS